MRLIASILLSAGILLADSPAVFQRVFSGITAAQSSVPIPNRGQTMHIVTVIFPAAVAPVSSIQVRLEGSFDNTTYFALADDITSAPLIGGLVYKVQAAFCPWPYLRVRSLTTTSSPMTVYYSGHQIPVVSLIQQQSDRFIQ